MSEGAAGEWYVLVEEQDVTDRWGLQKKLHMEGGREQALARARELSLNHPEGSKEYGRSVFRLSETSWLVELTESIWREDREEPSVYPRRSFRVSVGELVMTCEPLPAAPPEKHKRRWGSGR